MYCFTGVDPGIVHTGVVTFRFFEKERRFAVDSEAIAGLDVLALTRFLNAVAVTGPIFVEAYRPRSHFYTDQQMVEAMGKIRQINSRVKVLSNNGVKKVVKPELMHKLNVWTFPQRTHHDDLRSAARIGLLGALKDDRLNLLLTNFIIDMQDGRPWRRI